jgi:hypothetical protein
LHLRNKENKNIGTFNKTLIGDLSKEGKKNLFNSKTSAQIKTAHNKMYKTWVGFSANL